MEFNRVLLKQEREASPAVCTVTQAGCWLSGPKRVTGLGLDVLGLGAPVWCGVGERAGQQATES